ncbi:CMRF35-like molecule 5 isoform X1 [Onychostoma macrolepis]|uniref:CMRF35-like molecule 5 isoform X1 n=1 Tax=Onychostoma macrolepis TaxID=369639 RepID=UPI00272A9BD0|nr:CMRF35-like molecule 5 isoform X1 [Onychostoma macrolepis]
MFSVCVVLLVFSSICTVVVGAPETVTGLRGERLDIRCSYESGYESNSKYFCKGECIFGLRNIMVKSGSPAEDERFSLTDDTTARVFTVSITDLRSTDQGLYWCGVKRTLTTDVYSEILLLVKLDNKTTEASTINPVINTPSYFYTTELNLQSSSITVTERKETITDQHSSSTGSFVIIVTAEVLVLLLIGLTLIIVALWKKKKNKGLLSSSIEEFNPVIYEQMKDAGRHCNPEDRDTETSVVYSCVS